MLTVVIFTYKRLIKLNSCIQSLDSSNISEILIFNDDEQNDLHLDNINLKKYKNIITIYNPIDFGYKNRCFRKPIYINKATELSNNKYILFSDDDGVFSPGAIDSHINALKSYPFSAGGIIRSLFFNRLSKSILQGTNYAFQKKFLKAIEGYDENFANSMGGGDVDFWYRIYKYVTEHNIKVAYIPTATQTVTSKSTRIKNNSLLNHRDYTIKKHNLNNNGPMYNWFKNIRNKKNWMDIID